MSTPIVEKSTTSVGRWRLVALLMLFAAWGHFNRVGISVAGSEVFIPKMGMSETQMGWVYTMFLIVYTICQLPAGWLIDRIGSPRTLTLYGVSMGVCVALIGPLGWLGLSPAALWVGLLVLRGSAGLCNAPLHPAAAHVVSDFIPPKNRAAANGLVTAGALLGIACCYPGFGWMMDKLHWPLTFVVSGLLLAGYALVWRSMTRKAAVEAAVPATDLGVQEPSGSRHVLWDGNLWLLALSYAAYGYFQYLFFYWMDYYFKNVLRVPDVESRWASFWIMLAMGAGMAFGGILTDYVCRQIGQKPGRRTIVVAGMSLAALFALLGVRAQGHINVAMCLATSMAALGICEGVFWTTATDLGRNSRGFSSAMMNTGGNLGGLISPVLTPKMAESLGWPGSIAVACAVVAVGGAVWFIIRIPDKETAEFARPSSSLT